MKLDKFFEYLIKYQQLKYELKRDFERLRVELKLFYVAKLKELNNSK